MKTTRIISIDPYNPEEEHINAAAGAVARGKLVIIPTETVYGIACNMSNKKAIDRLYELKQRPEEKQFSLHIDRKERLEEFAADIPFSARKLINRFWPGPLTLIMKSKQDGTVGIRMPDNEIALRIIAKANCPVVCPSANISGRTPPVNFFEAIKELDGLVDIAIDAGPAKLGIESTVVDLTQEPLRIVREGAIKRQAIIDALKKKTVLFICTGNSCRSVMAKALLEKKLKEKGRSDVEVLSAGIMMLAGFGATEATREVLKKEGIDVSGHHSQRVNLEMIRRSDIILVMEKVHEEKIIQLAPEAKNRVFLLKEFAKINDNGLDIADPIGKPVEFYENTLRVIRAAVDTVAEIL